MRSMVDMSNQVISEQDWLARELVRREDGELAGALVPQGQLWLPCTVFGVAVDAALAEDDARDVLLTRGLSVLADRWEMRDGEDVVTVQIREATPEQVTVAFADYGFPDKFGQRVTLAAPVSQLRHVG